jgi:hypothetical protein
MKTNPDSLPNFFCHGFGNWTRTLPDPDSLLDPNLLPDLDSLTDPDLIQDLDKESKLDQD